jgi:DNA polymerase-3 subunit gamma/tau
MLPGDIQLYYQIALNGRRDIALSPHPRVGFEMVLLRMLAFTPNDSGSAATSGTTPGAGESVSARRPSAPQHLASGAPRHTASVTTQRSSCATAPTATAPSTPAAECSNSPQNTAAQVDAGELLTRWHEVIPQLSLDPMTEQFARNCSVRRVIDKTLTLAVDASVALLQNTTRTERLQKALAHRYAIPFVIELAAQDKLTDSPASREKAQRQARQADAQQSLLDDPVVRAVQERFDAILDQNTIQPN